MSRLYLREYSTKSICLIDWQLRLKKDAYQEVIIEKIKKGIDTKIEELAIKNIQEDLEFIKLVLIERYKKENMKLHKIASLMQKSRGGSYLALQKVFVYQAIEKKEMIEVQAINDVINNLPLDDVVSLANLAQHELIRSIATAKAGEYQESRYDEIEKLLSDDLISKIIADENEENIKKGANNYVKCKRK